MAEKTRSLEWLAAKAAIEAGLFNLAAAIILNSDDTQMDELFFDEEGHGAFGRWWNYDFSREFSPTNKDVENDSAYSAQNQMCWYFPCSCSYCGHVDVAKVFTTMRKRWRKIQQSQ